MSDGKQPQGATDLPSLPNAYDYAYEWESALGLTRSFDYRSRNGLKPDRHVSLFSEAQLEAYALQAIAEDRRQRAEPVVWRSALQFYADRNHFMLSNDDAWDTVSGEPSNFWCDEEGTATVEDGTVAARALAGDPLPENDDESPPAATLSAEPTQVASGEAARIAAEAEDLLQSASLHAPMNPTRKEAISAAIRHLVTLAAPAPVAQVASVHDFDSQPGAEDGLNAMAARHVADRSAVAQAVVGASDDTRRLDWMESGVWIPVQTMLEMNWSNREQTRKYRIGEEGPWSATLREAVDKASDFHAAPRLAAPAVAPVGETNP